MQKIYPISFQRTRFWNFPFEDNSVIDFKCKETCPYHCKHWMIMIGGYEWTGSGGHGLQEDKTLTLQIGKIIFYFYQE